MEGKAVWGEAQPACGKREKVRGGKLGFERRLLKKRAQWFLQFFPIIAAQNQFGAIAQMHGVVAMKEWREFLYSIKIDDGGTMNAQEFPGIQPLLRGGHRAAQQVRFAPDVQAHVIVGRFNPIDLFHPQEDDTAAGADDQALRFTLLLLKILK